MSLKKSRMRWALALIAAVVVGAYRLPGAQPAIKLKMATLAPKDSSTHKALLAMREKWRQAPCGGADLIIYTDGTAGDEPQVVSKMRIGQLQSAALTVTGLAEIDNSASALQSMPMMFRSYQELDYVRSKITPEIEKRFLEKGYVFLFWSDLGWVRFFSKEPLERPADLKKMNLFAWAGDNRYVELMKSLGYRPQPLAATDVLVSLQTGLIEVVPTVPLMALSGQYYRTARHMLDLNWAPLVGGAVISKKAWNSISECARPAILDAARVAGEEIKLKAREENDQSVQAMKKQGLVVHTATPYIESEWRKATEAAYPKIRGSLVPAEMFDRVEALLKDYRAGIGKSK